MRISPVTGLLLLLGLLLAPLPAAGYTASGNYWSENSITWYLHPSGSDDVAMATLKPALQAAFQEFQSLSCLSKNFVFGGEKSSNPKNGIYIKFQESSWDPTVGDAAAYSQSWTNWNGTISHNVIVFNGQDVTWTTTEANDFFSLKSDIQGVATHELGHTLGLGHSRLLAATMFFSGGSSSMRSLEQDDKNGICFIYSNFTQGQPCDSCEKDGNCASGYCLEYPDNGLYCGKNCTTDGNCPTNFYCYDLTSGTDQCAATNGYCSQDGGNIPVGYFCYGHETCVDGLCMVLPDGAYCTKECTADSQCPTPLKCIAEICLKGGSTPLGGDCSYHTDCASGMCLGISETDAVCTVTCAKKEDCPSGFGCYSGYCLPGGSKSYGAACSFDMECQSTTCLQVGGGKKICSQTCTSKADCPSQNPCTYASCIPPGKLDFGADCEAHTDCASGLCAGLSSKLCSIFCDGPEDCPEGAGCAGGGYCVPLQAPTGQCFGDDDCEGAQFCNQPGPGAAGLCTEPCNPFADSGCEPGSECGWLYLAWLDKIQGECLDDNGGGDEGESCDGAACRPNLACANIGGAGKRCHRDCNATTAFGCKSYEGCLALGIAADPHHGVCVCNDPVCLPVTPGDEDGGGAGPEILASGDSREEPSVGKPDSGGGGGPGGGGSVEVPAGSPEPSCAAAGRAGMTSVILLFLLTVGILFRKRRAT